MDDTGAGPRVVIAVQPRLLADSLARALRSDGVDVVVWLDTQDDRLFDMAIIMDSTPQPPDAPVVVRLPSADDATAEGSVTTVDGTQAALLDDLRGLIDTIHRFLGT